MAVPKGCQTLGMWHCVIHSLSTPSYVHLHSLLLTRCTALCSLRLCSCLCSCCRSNTYSLAQSLEPLFPLIVCFCCILALSHSCTHSIIHSLTHPLILLCMHPFIHFGSMPSLTHSLTHALTHSFMRSIICSISHLFGRLLGHAFVHSRLYSFWNHAHVDSPRCRYVYFQS